MFVCDLKETQGVFIGDVPLVVIGIPGDGTALVKLGQSDPFKVFPDRKTEVATGVLIYSTAKGLSRVQLHIAAPDAVSLRFIKDDTPANHRATDSRSAG